MKSQDYDWAVMDTMTGNVEFLSDDDYHKKCADKNYDNTHYPISKIVYEDYGVNEVFKKKPDISGLIPLVEKMEKELETAVEKEDYETAEEIKEVLNRWYNELDEEFNL